MNSRSQRFPRAPLYRRIIPVILLGLNAIAATSVYAAEWSVEPKVEMRIEHDTNRRLRIEDENASTAAVVKGFARFQRETATSFVELRPQVRVERSPDDSDEDSLDNEAYRLDAVSSKTLERWRLGLDGQVIRDTTLQSELEDSGRLDRRKRRFKWRVDPSLAYALTERTTANGGAAYEEVYYAASRQILLSDYKAGRVYTGLGYDLTPKDEVGFTLAYGYFEANLNDNETNNVSATVQWSRDFTETFSGSIRLGGRYTDSKFGIGDTRDSDSSTGFEGGARLEQELLQTSWFVSLDQGLVPSGQGQVREQTVLKFNADHRLQPRLTAYANGRVQRREDVDSRSRVLDRDYADLRGGLRWRLTRDWFLFGRYRYRYAKRDGQSSADSNSVMVGLQYELPSISISR